MTLNGQPGINVKCYNVAFVKLRWGRNELLQNAAHVAAPGCAFSVLSQPVQKRYKLGSVQVNATARSLVEDGDNTVMRLNGAAPAELFEYGAAADVSLELVLDAAVAVTCEYPVSDVALFYKHCVRHKEWRAVSSAAHEQIAKAALEKPAEEN